LNLGLRIFIVITTFDVCNVWQTAVNQHSSIVEDEYGNFRSTFSTEEKSFEVPQLNGADKNELLEIKATDESTDLGKGKRVRQLNSKYTNSKFSVMS